MITSHHFTDKESGAPAGGTTYGTGFAVSWQNGPLRVLPCPECTTPGNCKTCPHGWATCRLPQNGAFVEDIIGAAVDRLEYYQSSRFRSDYNEVALAHLNLALTALRARTEDRERRGVEGTHQI